MVDFRHALFMAVTRKEADAHPDYEIIANPALPYKPWFWDRIDEEGHYPVLIMKVIE